MKAKRKGFWKSYMENLKLVFVAPIFFVTFAFVYDPFGMRDFYEIGGLPYSFHYTMLFCILLLSLAISRIIYVAIDRESELDHLSIMLWCFMEIFASTCFIALYTTLFYGAEQTYFHSLSICLRNSFMILVYPYALFSLVGVIRRKDKELAEGPADKSLLKLYDEHHRLKMSIDPKAVLYLRAESNYIKVFYLDNDKIKEFLLRNSMKSLEASVVDHGIIRCHRSYYVNPMHIKVLRKDRDEGIIYADMVHEDAGSIPVSKNYFESLSKVL